jgi:hypothetical protein
MKKVSQQILKEDINRIISIIGYNEKTLNESGGPFIKRLIDTGLDLLTFIKKDGQNIIQKSNPELYAKIQSGAGEFTENEIKIIIKNLDLDRVVAKLMDPNTGLGIVKGFDRTFDTVLKKIESSVDSAIEQAKKDGKTQSQIDTIEMETVNRWIDKYLDVWYKEVIPNEKGDAFFGMVQGVGPEVNPIAEKFFDDLSIKFQNFITKKRPDWKRIIDPQKSTTRDFETWFTSKVASDSVTTILRFIWRRIFKWASTQKKLQQEFIDVANDMSKRIKNGMDVTYHQKKLADILSIAGSESEMNAKNIYSALLPKLPQNVIKDLDSNEVLKVVFDSIKKDRKYGNQIWNAIEGTYSQWKELLPLNFKDRKASFWNRWAQFIFKGTPETFDEIVLTLRQQGLGETVARKVAAGLIAKYTVGPLIVGTARTLSYIGQEAYQELDNLVGGRLPWGDGAPIDEEFIKEKGWIIALLYESFEEWTKLQLGLSSAWPCRTYIFDLWDIIESVTHAVSKDDTDKATDKALEQSTDPEIWEKIKERRKDGSKKDSKISSVPQDLLNSFDGDIEYLKERVYMFRTKDSEGNVIEYPAIAFEKGRRDSIKDVKIVNPDGNWSVVGSKGDGSSKNLKLKDSETKELLKRYIPSEKNNVQEQFIIPDEPNPSPKPQTNTPQTTPTPTQVKDDGVYKPCKGFNKLFCKSDSIKKVQTCLELEPTGNYDQKLNNILGSYGFLSGFNDTDVERICNEVQRRKEGQGRLDAKRDAKIQQKKREQDEFRRQYPQTIQNPATETDDWG